MDVEAVKVDQWYTNLSQSQLLFWLGQELSKDKPFYNMVLIFDLKGRLDVNHFQAAFQMLLQRSDALRTVFEVKDGQPVQRVLQEAGYDMEFLDWSNDAAKREEYSNWIQERTQYNFDLSKCLTDSVLIKFSENHFTWYLNQHHLVTDAWSVSVIYKALAQFYQLSIDGHLDQAPQLPSFRNYLDFEKVARANPEKREVHQFWKDKLADLPSIPQFYGRKNILPTTRNDRVFFNLGLDRSTQLRAIAMEKGVRSWTQHLSLFNIFSTILFSYLYRVCGQDQLMIGTPSHNRPSADFKNTIGVFIEIFPLLASIEEGETFTSLLKKVQVESNDFLRYAQPGAANAELSRRFNVILNYIHASFSDFNGIPMDSEWVHPGHCDPRHHLRLQVHDFDRSGAIQLFFDLNKNIFDETQQELVPQHFAALLDAFIADRTQEIAAVPLISDQEHQALVFDFNKKETAITATSSIITSFEAQVAQTPEAIAVTFQDTQLTYDQLNQKANQIARYLMAKGIDATDRVVICLKRTPEFIISVLAVLKSGATYIPVPSTTPNERVYDLLDDSGASLFISDNRLTNCMNIKSTDVLYMNHLPTAIETMDKSNLEVTIAPDAIAYMIYTSGSTGKPKGVKIAHCALANYIDWAKKTYISVAHPAIPLFTTVGFDLTITSTFLPLVCGGQLVIYQESDSEVDLSILEVIEANAVDFIKLTPAHLAFLQGMNLCESRIQSIVVGGEDFKTDLARTIYKAFGEEVRIYNEYGPTEATVGCIVHAFAEADTQQSVPIGKPIDQMQAYVLDAFLHPVPQGVSGELYLAGSNLAKGYWKREELTVQNFIANPFTENSKLYKTGDLVRINKDGNLEFLGRIDRQVKMRGWRIELGEIEVRANDFSGIQQCIIELVEQKKHKPAEIHNCVRCGLPSNYPNTAFDEEGLCELCINFENYQQKVQRYFKTERDLKQLFTNLRKENTADYDCIALLSGGKDSTYALAKLVELGARVLAFTLDNGYISDQAKANIRRVVNSLGVDHVFSTTPAMNAIFVDSLHRYSNVCNGCFKTIYTLSIQLALEKNIPYIVTGLSRGQFFETRLTEELFRNFDLEKIDQTILDARIAYHQTEDAVNRLLKTTALFEDESIFEKVQFLDFYRFTDVSMEEMMNYLETRLPWQRPTDTGRSTNCLINQVGIHVHKAKEGYSNYSFPYSWDVRVGHKTRAGALDEINEVIDVQEVERIMDEIGYTEINDNQHQKHLVAYFTADSTIKPSELQAFLGQKLPAYMIPSRFRQLETFPLSANGKIDRKALKQLDVLALDQTIEYVPPQTEIEEVMVEIWEEVLNTSPIGIHDNFIELGGNSLLAIRIIARINEAIELEIPVNIIFELLTIEGVSAHVEGLMLEILREIEED